MGDFVIFSYFFVFQVRGVSYSVAPQGDLNASPSGGV